MQHDENCSSCCMLSLIRLYLNIGSKCNRAASCLFMKELALLWCGRQFLEIISSFFLCSRSLGLLFVVPNFTDGFMRLSLTVKWNRKRMLLLSLHNECYRYPHVTELCSTEMVYDITLIYRQTVSSPLFSSPDFVWSCSLSQWWRQVRRMRLNKVS